MQAIDFEELYVGFVEKTRKSNYQNSGSVSLKDLKSGQTKDFEFECECDLPGAFEMAKALGMPIGFLQMDEKDIFIGSFVWAAKDPMNEVEGGVEVTIDVPANVKYLVDKTNPDFEQIKSDVEDSIKNKTKYWFSIVHIDDETPRIVKVTDYTPLSTCDQSFESTEFDEASASVYTSIDAQDIFDFLIDNSVTSANQSPSLIPYGFLLDGCGARAHKAADLLSKHRNIETEKIWLFGKAGYSLKKVETDQFPGCSVEWGFHVANAVFTDNGYIILDPSLFNGPVSLSTWRQKLDNGHTLMYKTSRQVFDIRAHHCHLDSDPQFARTNRDLEIYTINLILQWYYFGFPPYSCHCEPSVQTS